MALIGLKQLDNILTGSLQVSGSAGVTGSIEVSGNISGSVTSTGSFGYMNVSGDTVIGGNLIIGDADTDSVSFGAEISSSIVPDADSSYDIGSSSKNWRYGYIEQLSATHVTASGNISGSSTSTGSFGRIETAGNINTSGRIYEDGSSVIDHATAMAIVFGG